MADDVGLVDGAVEAVGAVVEGLNAALRAGGYRPIVDHAGGADYRSHVDFHQVGRVVFEDVGDEFFFLGTRKERN